ncbi:ECF transporter S component [Alkalicella caledoniensis]|uniref:Riboflavin transporter n=1 Tax=Alkalicella caledoniensis TaxID=2731377 RepID=A0A7G9WAK2_ALKCA|nr:ECF transporter S component [Alkalicella caledoniensis]QNO15714.1 ECF transporter S component [Alkalicella caledoniensis]
MQIVSKVNNKKRVNIKTLIKVSLLGGIAFLIYALNFPVFFAPGFLKWDPSEIPALIAGFSLGPVAGVGVIFVKNIIHLFKTETFGVGELSNFIIGTSYVLTASLIYRYNKTKKGALLGLAVGTIAMTIAGALSNYYMIIPFYAKVMGFSTEAIIGMGTIVNKNIVDMRTLIILGITPFNLFKGVTVSAITLLIYKKVAPLLNK